MGSISPSLYPNEGFNFPLGLLECAQMVGFFARVDHHNCVFLGQLAICTLSDPLSPPQLSPTADCLSVNLND